MKTMRIKKHLFFSKHTLADWRQFINEVICDYVELNSVKIGGVGKIVEVDESKFGKRKYNRGHRVEGQWVFGGVERGSGKLFLVPVPDRTANTLLSIIEQYVEKGTTIYSDQWRSYDRLKEKGVKHFTVNHSIHFVDPSTGVHTNTIESYWRHIKATLPAYNRRNDFKYYLANYMFHFMCADQKVDVFNKFIEIVREIKWEEKTVSWTKEKED